jgi:hypothetical protein
VPVLISITGITIQHCYLPYTQGSLVSNPSPGDWTGHTLIPDKPVKCPAWQSDESYFQLCRSASTLMKNIAYISSFSKITVFIRIKPVKIAVFQQPLF